MDIIKSGNFIREERTKCGLTQKELADKIGVTDKAVSKWETGRGFPDVSLLKPLSQALNISVTELIEGEKIKENPLDTSDKIIIETYNQKALFLKTASVILIIIGVSLLFLPLFWTGFGIIITVSPCIGILLITAGIVIRSKKTIMNVEKLKLGFLCRPLAMLSIILAIVLEAQPDSFIMAFAAPPDSGIEAFYVNCSYFSLLPMGYGNWLPILTAAMSCVSALLLAILIILNICKKTPKKLTNALFVCTCTALFFSLLANFLLVDKNTSCGFGITLLLIMALLLQWGRLKN